MDIFDQFKNQKDKLCNVATYRNGPGDGTPALDDWAGKEVSSKPNAPRYNSGTSSQRLPDVHESAVLVQLPHEVSAAPHSPLARSARWSNTYKEQEVENTKKKLLKTMKINL